SARALAAAAAATAAESLDFGVGGMNVENCAHTIAGVARSERTIRQRRSTWPPPSRAMTGRHTAGQTVEPAGRARVWGRPAPTAARILPNETCPWLSTIQRMSEFCFVNPHATTRD